jgi:hypothetical protein
MLQSRWNENISPQVRIGPRIHGPAVPRIQPAAAADTLGPGAGATCGARGLHRRQSAARRPARSTAGYIATLRHSASRSWRRRAAWRSRRMNTTVGGPADSNWSLSCLASEEEEQCAVCQALDYWLEGPLVLVICLAGIIGGSRGGRRQTNKRPRCSGISGEERICLEDEFDDGLLCLDCHNTLSPQLGVRVVEGYPTKRRTVLPGIVYCQTLFDMMPQL